MKIDNPTLVAKWFNTSVRNIHATYKKKKPAVYDVMCCGAAFKEHNITHNEIEILILVLKDMRVNRDIQKGVV